MLLRHPWLAPLMERPADLDSDGPDAQTTGAKTDTEDEEVATWAKVALKRRSNGQIGDIMKPALHAVALDAVGGGLY